MRDGRFVRTAAARDLTVDEVIRSMVGRDLDVLFPKTATAVGEVVLEVGLLSRTRERDLAATWASRLQLKFGRLWNAVSMLSGGNQQKVVLGKWLARGPSLLIIDEPTRGIDVGTKAEVHRILDGLVADGLAVLMISSELPEVLGMADRILVMREGRITAELSL